MSDQQNENNAENVFPSPEELTATMANIAERSQALVNGFISNQSGAFGMGDPRTSARPSSS